MTKSNVDMPVEGSMVIVAAAEGDDKIGRRESKKSYGVESNGV